MKCLNCGKKAKYEENGPDGERYYCSEICRNSYRNKNADNGIVWRANGDMVEIDTGYVKGTKMSPLVKLYKDLFGKDLRKVKK